MSGDADHSFMCTVTLSKQLLLDSLHFEQENITYLGGRGPTYQKQMSWYQHTDFNLTRRNSKAPLNSFTVIQ